MKRGSVRVVWVSSVVQVNTPKGGVELDDKGNPVQLKGMLNYMQSKVGGVFLGHEIAQRLNDSGVFSVVSLLSYHRDHYGLIVLEQSLHPGLMRTELQRHNPAIQRIFMVSNVSSFSYDVLKGNAQGIVFKGPRYGAYTELYAGLSPDVTRNENGSFYIPWGRLGELPQHLKKSMAPTGTEPSISSKFYAWCDRQVARFL